MESVIWGNIRFSIWDVGGQRKMRRFWHYYYPWTHGLVFVLDSTDRARIGKARKKLAAMLAEEDLAKSILLIIANKQVTNCS